LFVAPPATEHGVPVQPLALYFQVLTSNNSDQFSALWIQSDTWQRC